MHRILLALAVWAAGFPAPAQQIVSIGYSPPAMPSVAPGQVVTLFVNGLNVPDATAVGLPLPRTLGGVTVKVKSSGNPDYPANLPIFSLRSAYACGGRAGGGCPLLMVTVQIPMESPCVATDHLPNECTLGPSVVVLAVEANGVAGPDLPVTVSISPQILNSCHTIFGIPGGSCYPFVSHADGTLVTGQYPAHPGETIVIYATGLGPTDPSVPTGEASTTPVPAPGPLFLYGLTIGYELATSPASTPEPVQWIPHEGYVFPGYVGLVPGFVGLYQMNVTLPAEMPARVAGCGGFPAGMNTRIAIGVGDFGPADGSSHVDICVEP